MEGIERIKITRNDFIERLIYNDFDVYEIKDRKLYINGCKTKVKSDSVIGYTYDGEYEDYYYELEEDEKVENIIYAAFIQFKELVFEKLKQETDKLIRDFNVNLGMF